MWPNVRESQLLRSLLRTCHRSQFTPRATHIIYHGETGEGMTAGGARGGEGRLRDRERVGNSKRAGERERGGWKGGWCSPIPPCPRCLYFYCGECSVASSVVFRNYDTIPLHPLDRCTAARQSLYILRYNRSTSLPVKYITASRRRGSNRRESAAVLRGGWLGANFMFSILDTILSEFSAYLGHWFFFFFFLMWIF